MNIRKIFLNIFLICTVALAHAQDGVPVFADYFVDNLYLLHPSSAGAADYSKLRVTARQQWLSQEQAPNLQTLSFNTRLNDRSGFGAIAFRDQNGFNSQLGGYLTYAHHIRFSRSAVDLNQLSFGLSAGIIQSRLDETQFDPSNFDPIVAGIIQSSSYFNIDFGLSYNLLNFSTHFTVKNLLFQNRSLFTEDFEPNNQRSYNFSSAYFIGSSGFWSYEPSFLFQWRERTGESSIDVNFKAYREVDFGRIWGGLSYRRSLDGAQALVDTEITNQKLQFFSPVIGINYNKFIFAYTYSQQIGAIRLQNSGFHQITIGYNFLEGKINSWNQDMRYNGMLRPKYK